MHADGSHRHCMGYWGGCMQTAHTMHAMHVIRARRMGRLALPLSRATRRPY